MKSTAFKIFQKKNQKKVPSKYQIDHIAISKKSDRKILNVKVLKSDKLYSY